VSTSIKTRLIQGALVTVAQRSRSKSFDPVKERARGARLEKRFKPKPGVIESEVMLGGVPCRRFTAGGTRRGTFFHLHGGACTAGSAAVGRLYTHISQGGGPDVLSVEYRLAPEHPYPAAVDDARAAYLALIETVPAEKVVVGGESAGANLALALVQRLVAEGLPLPVAVVPVYPWSDLTHASQSWVSNGRRDILTREGIDPSARAYAAGLALDDPRVSPQFGSFTGFPPAFIPVGTRDCLLDDARAVARAMREAGVEVTLREWDDAVHGFTLLPTRESREAMAAIREFVLGYLPA
jgi:acetyl esterase/lipase